MGNVLALMYSQPRCTLFKLKLMEELNKLKEDQEKWRTLPLSVLDWPCKHC